MSLVEAKKFDMTLPILGPSSAKINKIRITLNLYYSTFFISLGR